MAGGIKIYTDFAVAEGKREEKEKACLPKRQPLDHPSGLVGCVEGLLGVTLRYGRCQLILPKFVFR